MKLFVFPGNIEKEILEIGSQQIPYMRTQEFSNIVKDSEEKLLNLIGCKNGRTIFYTSSGTGAMDAVVSNIIINKKKTLVIAGGAFGYRWRDLCEYYKCPYSLFEVPFAKDIDYQLLEEQVNKYKPEALLCQHHETSSGVLFNISQISHICKKNNTLFVVDAISSFLADPFKMDEMGIDVSIISSQKGLNIPPGLSFVILSQEALKEKFNHKGFYFDFNENLKNLTRGQTPYSPATTLFLQLHARLNKVQNVGVETILEEIKRKALYFRNKCNENNWDYPAASLSNCITGFTINNNNKKIFEELLKNNIHIMPSSKENYFRVSHLGLQTLEDINNLTIHIKRIERNGKF